MSLLAEIGEALRGAMDDDVFPPATLHVTTDARGAYGETLRSFADHPANGFVARWSAEMMAARGYDNDWAKVVLVQGATLPRPKLGDEITAQRPITGTLERYRVMDVSADPADATWQVAGAKVG